MALGEGPAVTVMTEGVPVRAAGSPLPGRWPLYGPAVGELGVRAVIAVPLRRPLPVWVRVERALSELDGALRDVRRLMITCREHARGPVGDSGAADGNQRVR